MPMRSQVFKKYVLSYLSGVLVVCMALGLILERMASDQLRQAEMDIYQTRLTQTADYIEQQLAAMQDIHLSIKTELPFQPFYLKRQKTNEFDLLESFARYANYSPWIEDYYLWYQDEAKVFGTRSAYSQRIFFQKIMKELSPESVAALAGDPGKPVFLLPETRPDVLLIGLPFYFGTANNTSGRCMLIFLVKMTTIRQTICRMTGLAEDGGFLLAYEGTPFLSTLDTAKTVDGLDAQGKIRVSIEEPSMEELQRLTSFEQMMLAILAATLLLGTIFAFLLAWRNYQPIRKLVAKYSSGHKPATNELRTLEELLGSALKRNNAFQKQIEEQIEELDLQHSWLKQQLVMMLITNNDSPVVKKLIQKMGFEMPHAFFVICFLYLQGEGGDRTGLVRSIEDFSDEECTLYVAELQENREYIVLMNFQEEEQGQTLLEMLTDSMESRSLSVQLQLSRPCTQLNEIASAAIEALSKPLMALTADGMENSSEDALEQLTALTESGSTSQALALLDTLIAQTESRYPSYLMQIYMLNRLMQQVMALCSQQGVPLPREPIGQDPERIRETLREMIRTLCHRAETQKHTEKPKGGRVSAYIQAHCLDGDISLSSTAEALSISTKQVSRLLGAEVGMTFKEYLVQLRMDAAQRLLRDEGLSIAETANRVGYFNISHFIKCFKTYTGMTPGEWKKLSPGG